MRSRPERCYRLHDKGDGYRPPAFRPSCVRLFRAWELWSCSGRDTTLISSALWIQLHPSITSDSTDLNCTHISCTAGKLLGATTDLYVWSVSSTNEELFQAEVNQWKYWERKAIPVFLHTKLLFQSYVSCGWNLYFYLTLLLSNFLLSTFNYCTLTANLNSK